MRLILLAAFGLCVADAQITVSNPYQIPNPPTGVVITVSAGNVTAITLTGGVTPCAQNVPFVVLGTNGGGVNAYGTITCTANLLVSPATVTGQGTGYSQGQTALVPQLLNWVLTNNHNHIQPTAGIGPYSCQAACMDSCTGYDVAVLTNKTIQSMYTAADPGAACRTVGQASCPARNAATFTIASSASGNGVSPIHIVIANAATGIVNGTPVYITGAAGDTAMNTADVTDNPWYAANVAVTANTDLDLLKPSFTNGVVTNVNTTSNGTYTASSATISFGGCSSAYPGTASHAVTLFPGYEDTQTDSSPLMTQWSGTGHHFSTFNVSGLPVATNTTRLAAVKWALDNPATADGSIITIAHPTSFPTTGWTAFQQAAVLALAPQYPGQIHLQVFDGQGGYNEFGWDQALNISPTPIWGDASDDSYGVPSSNMHQGCLWTNANSSALSDLIPSLKVGRMYFSHCGDTFFIAPRFAVSGTTIYTGIYTAEPAQANSYANRTVIWIGSGGRILQVNASAPLSSYTVTGTEGKYVRVVIVANLNGHTQYTYMVGGNISNNYYYPNEFYGATYSEPFFISNTNGAGAVR